MVSTSTAAHGLKTRLSDYLKMSSASAASRAAEPIRTIKTHGARTNALAHAVDQFTAQVPTAASSVHASRGFRNRAKVLSKSVEAYEASTITGAPPSKPMSARRGSPLSQLYKAVYIYRRGLLGRPSP